MSEGKRAETKAQRLLRLLLAKRGAWVTGWQLVKEGCGLRFGHSVYLLRQGKVTGQPVNVEARAVNREKGIWAYRIPTEPTP